MSDFLGKRLPRDLEADLVKIQSATLAAAHPLISAWSNLLQEVVKGNTGMLVPATEVLAMVPRSLCLIGNASELIFQTRPSRVVEAINPSWKRFGEDEFPSSQSTLLGDDFQTSQSSSMEKDNALTKAVLITKNSRRETDLSTRRDWPNRARVLSCTALLHPGATNDASSFGPDTP